MLNPDTTAATFGGFELCYADLGDTRLKTRAAALVNALVNHPGQSVPTAIADTAAIKAAYYFFENQAVDEAAIRQGHRLHTIERARPLPRILILQDDHRRGDAARASWPSGPTARHPGGARGRREATGGRGADLLAVAHHPAGGHPGGRPHLCGVL